MSIELVDRKSDSGARRTKTIFQPRERVVDVLKKKYDWIAKLDPPQHGWAEFRDWIDSTRIAIEHSFGKGSDQEREFMRIEYAPQMDGYESIAASTDRHIDEHLGGSNKGSSLPCEYNGGSRLLLQGR